MQVSFEGGVRLEFRVLPSSCGCNLWLEARRSRQKRSPGGSPVAGTFEEKERMVVASTDRICNFAITHFTDKSEFV